ncbi:MAG: stage II sporulation protein P [Eubacteriaceae bacterium]|nr:stage II sporulation protein P [Eubacteriaceae bacterium]
MRKDKEIKAAAMLLALLLVNLPFQYSPTKGPQGQSPNYIKPGSFAALYSNIFFCGTGTANMNKDASSMARAKINAPYMLLSYAIPALSYYNGYMQNPEHYGENDIYNRYAQTLGMSEASYIDTQAQYHRGNPRVLIYHTHTTESYANEQGASHSKNHQINVVSIGTIMCKTLYEDYGIESLHLTDVFNDIYTQSYDASLAAINSALERYSSIEYIIDVHRDSISEANEHTKGHFTTMINGMPAARVELVLGLKASYVNENKEFRSKVKSRMESMYPGLWQKDIDKETSQFNQFLRPNSLLIEVGIDLNTPEEAKHSAALMGRVLATVILEQ